MRWMQRDRGSTRTLNSPAPIPLRTETASAPAQAVEVELIAVVVAATGDEPRVLTIRDGRLLPSGPFETAHRSLQAGLRAWVEHQTHHPLGYVEQLHPFADRGRPAEDMDRRGITISYLGLTRHPAEADAAAGAGAG